MLAFPTIAPFRNSAFEQHLLNFTLSGHRWPHDRPTKFAKQRDVYTSVLAYRVCHLKLLSTLERSL